MINSKLLKEKIHLKGYTITEFARLLGIHRTTLWRKIVGKVKFKPSELFMICNLLDIGNIQEIYKNDNKEVLRCV